jgi:HSP20 family protein
MHVELSKWNPFRFLRRSPEEKRGASHPSAAAPLRDPDEVWREWPDLSMLNPFRMVNELLDSTNGSHGQSRRWFGDYSPSVFQPRMDVVDESKTLRITAELPGLDRGDVEVALEDHMLVLRGEKKLESKKEEQGCYRVERAFGSFERVIPLPDGVDVDRAEATFDKGVLTIRLPKAATARQNGRLLEIK